MKNSIKGFTLIELLVVIAIIGMISSVALAALGSAKSKATDTAAKADLESFRKQTQIFWTDNNGSYSTLMCSDPTIAPLLDNAYNAGHFATSPACNSKSSAWYAAGQLKSGGYWCVDSTQTAKFEPSAVPGGSYACP